MPRAPSTLGDEPGGFVTRAGHRLQDGRHTGRDAGTAAEKHALQARVYADVLHKAGFEAVTVKFVRAEQVDPANPCEPQVVTYNL